MKHSTVIFVCQNCKSDVPIELADLNEFRRDVLMDFMDWLYEFEKTNRRKSNRLKTMESYLKDRNINQTN